MFVFVVQLEVEKSMRHEVALNDGWVSNREIIMLIKTTRNNWASVGINNSEILLDEKTDRVTIKSTKPKKDIKTEKCKQSQTSVNDHLSTSTTLLSPNVNLCNLWITNTCQQRPQILGPKDGYTGLTVYKDKKYIKQYCPKTKRQMKDKKKSEVFLNKRTERMTIKWTCW